MGRGHVRRSYGHQPGLVSYPILDLDDAPDAIDIVVLLDRPDLPPSRRRRGAIRPVAAAIGNAIFDATGVRVRRAPFTPSRIKEAIGVPT